MARTQKTKEWDVIANPRKIRNFSMTLLAAAMFWGCGGPDSSASDTATQSESGNSATTAADATREESSMPVGGYAPKLTMPSKKPDHVEVPLAEMFLKSATVPAAADVNVPVYPGARIMSTMAGVTFDTDSGEGKSLPGMILLSSGDLESVLAFYQEQLPGWQYKDFFGVHTFWNGPEGSNPLDITAGHSMLSLSELEEGEVQRLLWPEMRTKIDMAYDKPGG
jgi:hypothetical protein